jgi:hypothetical protein
VLVTIACCIITTIALYLFSGFVLFWFVKEGKKQKEVGKRRRWKNRIE